MGVHVQGCRGAVVGRAVCGGGEVGLFQWADIADTGDSCSGLGSCWPLCRPVGLWVRAWGLRAAGSWSQRLRLSLAGCCPWGKTDLFSMWEMGSFRSCTDGRCLPHGPHVM